MDGRFIEAFTLLPTQGSVCGYMLKPICLRHRLILESFKSPFVDNSFKAKPKDIIIAARIFSSTTMEDINSIKVNENDVEWVKKMENDKVLYTENLMKIIRYMSENAKWPSFWNRSKAGRDHGIPWMLNIVCTLTKNGIPLEQAWTMPECQAIWMSVTFNIASGADVDIVSEDDLAAMNFARSLKSKGAEQCQKN